jgi:hypothetical protein
MKVFMVTYRRDSKRRVYPPTHVTSRCLVLKARCDTKNVHVFRSTRRHGNNGLRCRKQKVLAGWPRFTARKPSSYSELPSLFILRRVRKIGKSDFWLRHACLWVYQTVRPSVRLSICPSVLMEQLGSHWTDLYQI